MGSAQPPLPLSSPSDLEKHDKVVRAMFERMQSYSRVIIGLAYAGLLAIWSATKQVLPERLLVASGLFIILSILAYAVFEVGQMIFYTWMSWKYGNDTRKGSLAVALSEFEKRGKRWEAPWLLVWLITLVIAVLTGFGAAGILIYAFCRRLLRVD